MVDYCNCKQAMHTFGKLYVCVSDKMHRCYFYSQSFEIEQIYLHTWHTIIPVFAFWSISREFWRTLTSSTHTYISDCFLNG